MNIHEYQAKALLSKFGVAVPRGGVAYTPDEAAEVARGLGGPVYVVKAQSMPAAAARRARQGAEVDRRGSRFRRQLIGMKLITHQTGPAGKEVKRVYVEEGCDIKRELYLGILIDRATSRITVMASTEGGMEIEEVAASTRRRSSRWRSTRSRG